MKKFVENIDPEIFWVTILLILSVVVYYFELNLNWILLAWMILSCAISYIYYRKLQFLADKNKIEKFLLVYLGLYFYLLRFCFSSKFLLLFF